MSAVPLHGIEASLHSPAGGSTKGGDDLLNLLVGDLPRCQAKDQGPDRRRSNGFPLLQKIKTFPSSMMELQGHLATGSMHRIGNLFQTGDKPVIIGSQLIHDGRTAWMDGGNFGYDQASPSHRPALYISKVCFAHRAVRIPEVGPHGTHDCPVDQVQRFYLDRGKKGCQEIHGFSFV